MHTNLPVVSKPLGLPVHSVAQSSSCVAAMTLMIPIAFQNNGSENCLSKFRETFAVLAIHHNKNPIAFSHGAQDKVPALDCRDKGEILSEIGILRQLSEFSTD